MTRAVYNHRLVFDSNTKKKINHSLCVDVFNKSFCQKIFNIIDLKDCSYPRFLEIGILTNKLLMSYVFTAKDRKRYKLHGVWIYVKFDKSIKRKKWFD